LQKLAPTADLGEWAEELSPFHAANLESIFGLVSLGARTAAPAASYMQAIQDLNQLQQAGSLRRSRCL
jgi:hypothetical protein